MSNHNHHDHDHDHNEELDTIILTLDDDSEVECGVLGIYEVDDATYIALLTMEDEQVLLYKYFQDEEDEEAFTLEIIEDDEEFSVASDAFYELFVEDDESDEEDED